jgi:hypothetical protein
MKLTEAQVKVLRILYEEKVDLHDRVLGSGESLTGSLKPPHEPQAES